MDIEMKMWGYTSTGTKLHGFVNGTAMCRTNIKAPVQELADFSEAKSHAKAQWGISMCTTCESKFNAAVERAEAAMQPSTGEGDYLPPAAEAIETELEQAHAEALEINAGLDAVRSAATALQTLPTAAERIVEGLQTMRENAQAALAAATQAARTAAPEPVTGSPYIGRQAYVSGASAVLDHAAVGDNARIFRATVRGNAVVSGSAFVKFGAVVGGDAAVGGDARVLDGALVYGTACITHGYVGHHADVYETSHVVCLHGWSPWLITMYRTATGARVQAGCQNFDLYEEDPWEVASSCDEDGSLPTNWPLLTTFLKSIADRWPRGSREDAPKPH